MSVAVDDDLMVVGASSANSGGSGRGQAYVFQRSGGSWSQIAILKASDQADSDEFGMSVAISGNTVDVGARHEDSSSAGVDGDQLDDSLQSAGAAYVFVRNGTTWTQQAYLKASNTDAGDNFGRSVAVFIM